MPVRTLRNGGIAAMNSGGVSFNVRLLKFTIVVHKKFSAICDHPPGAAWMNKTGFGET